MSVKAEEQEYRKAFNRLASNVELSVNCEAWSKLPVAAHLEATAKLVAQVTRLERENETLFNFINRETRLSGPDSRARIVELKKLLSEREDDCVPQPWDFEKRVPKAA